MSRKKQARRLRRTVAVVGDGQTERIYFADIRDTDRPKDLTIFPDYPRKIGSYRGVLGRAVELREYYDKVFALVDLDKVIQEGQQIAYGRDKKAAVESGVEVLENNPCFEIWLLLHFHFTGKLFDNCSGVVRELSNSSPLSGYDKSEKYLKKAQLYKSYKHLIEEKAIPNARRLETGSEDRDDLYPKAQIFKFFEWYFGLAGIL